MDKNHNQISEEIRYYFQGSEKLKRIERDRNEDNKVDQWTYYKKLQKFSYKQEEDSNFDGKKDLERFYDPNSGRIIKQRNL